MIEGLRKGDRVRCEFNDCFPSCEATGTVVDKEYFYDKLSRYGIVFDELPAKLRKKSSNFKEGDTVWCAPKDITEKLKKENS